MMNVKVSPSGTEFELKITAGPVKSELIDKLQARSILVIPFPVRNKDIVQRGNTPGCKGCRAARAGIRQQAHDKIGRTQILNELMRTANGKNRIDKDEETRQDKRARIDRAAHGDNRCNRLT